MCVCVCGEHGSGAPCTAVLQMLSSAPLPVSFLGQEKRRIAENLVVPERIPLVLLPLLLLSSLLLDSATCIRCTPRHSSRGDELSSIFTAHSPIVSVVVVSIVSAVVVHLLLWRTRSGGTVDGKKSSLPRKKIRKYKELKGGVPPSNFFRFPSKFPPISFPGIPPNFVQTSS